MIDGHDRRAKYFHLIHVTSLAFLLSLAINGFVTEFLKLRVGKLRPDFLARCGPLISAEDGPSNQVYNDTICSKPLGEALFRDGYKSCPSGHSSFAWCGFNFLNLWLSGQFRLHAPIDPEDTTIESSGNSRYHRFHLIQLVNLVPLGFCLHIALSRSQDYRHDFVDICLGSLIGFLVSTFIYSQFFRSIFGYNCSETKFSDYKLLQAYGDIPV
ncbi:DEKNAAC104753 [Brettanomyces naardenensis]|uniref:DEKNAAC104753 n=1 Tax=Brettanomyces naardenensis TaxID=13370 RepID=A0A448YRN3_BRENA|nr:DEKNAAC104753 [Brettanomyces naardenensis]